MARVFIGVDHTPSSTIEVVDERETVLATGRFATVGGCAVEKNSLSAPASASGWVSGSACPTSATSWIRPMRTSG